MAIKKPVGKKVVEKERPSERAMRESEPAFKKAQEKMRVQETLPEVRKTGGAVSTEVMDFEADAGAGVESADKSAFAIPFLVMLQGLSPQLETVDGAAAGMFLNTITNELYDEGVKVIPCYYQRQFNRWAPDRGGFRGTYLPEDVETGKLKGLTRHQETGLLLMDVPEGEKNVLDKEGKPRFDHLQDTRVHFVLVYSDDTDQWVPAILSLSSTQIKKSRNWMSLITGIKLKGKNGLYNPPSFSHIYLLKPVKQENKKGSWWGMDAEIAGPVEDKALYETAKMFYESVKGGAIVAPPPPSDPDAGGDADSRL